MSSKSEEVSKLKSQIIECQEETLQLLHESQLWRDKYKLEEQAKMAALGALTSRVHSIESIFYESQLKNLDTHLKQREETESRLKELLETNQVEYAECKKSQKKQLLELERMLEEDESSYDEAANIKLHKSRVEMEKRLESLNRFYEAVYSTLESKKSSSVSLVKEAQLDHPDGQEMRILRGSKKTQ